LKNFLKCYNLLVLSNPLSLLLLVVNGLVVGMLMVLVLVLLLLLLLLEMAHG
jgi:hypothetical protein